MKITINFFLIATLLTSAAQSTVGEREEVTPTSAPLKSDSPSQFLEEPSMPDLDTLPPLNLTPAQKIVWCIACCWPCVCMMGQLMRCVPFLKARK